MDSRRQTEFIRFLKEDIAIDTAELQLALRHPEQTLGLLPMILWQYGLVNLVQLNQIFDWLEK